MATWSGLWARMRAAVGNAAEEAKTGWNASVDRVYERVQQVIGPKVEANPQAAEADARRMMVALDRWARADRAAMEVASAMPYGAARNAAILRIATSMKRRHALAAPFWAQSSVGTDQVGAVFVPLLIVAGVGLALGAVSWAVASWRDVAVGAEYAESYRAYLQAHGDALAKGLPAPEPPAPPTAAKDPLSGLASAASQAGGAIIGVLLVGGAVAAGVALLRSR